MDPLPVAEPRDSPGRSAYLSGFNSGKRPHPGNPRHWGNEWGSATHGAALRNPMGKGGAGSGSGGPVEKRRRRRGRGRGHCQVFPTLLYIDTSYTHRTHTHTHTRGGVEGVEEPEASAGRGLLFLPLFIFSWFLLLQLPRRFLLPFSKSTGSNMQMRRIPQRLPIRPGSTCQFLPPINNCFISNGLLFISCAGGNVVYNYEIVSVNPMEMMRVSAFQIHFPPPSQKKRNQ